MTLTEKLTLTPHTRPKKGMTDAYQRPTTLRRHPVARIGHSKFFAAFFQVFPSELFTKKS